MKCPNCKEEISNNSKFCSNCGIKIKLSCPKCKSVIKQGDNFCSNCGCKLIKVNDLELDDNIEAFQTDNCESTNGFGFLDNRTNEEIKQYIDNNIDIIEEIAFYLADNFEIIKYLIEEKNLDVNFKNEIAGETILFPACDTGNLDLVKYLVEEKNLDINSKNELEQTPLFGACCCEKGNLELVKYLVKEKGLNVNARDINGESVLSYAEMYGTQEIINYLIKLGAKL